MEQPGDAKAHLLARIVDEVARNGLADRSLRDIASGTGTSHRMLLYHFGSREGLVAAVVDAVEAAQRSLLGELSEQSTSPADLIRAMWRQVSGPELRPFIQLFFETVSYASRGSGAGSLTSPWMADAASASARLGIGFDPVATRLGIAVIRGLLIDVMSGEYDDATAALELFIELSEPHGHAV